MLFQQATCNLSMGDGILAVISFLHIREREKHFPFVVVSDVIAPRRFKIGQRFLQC